MGYAMNTTGENVYEPIVERLSSRLNDGEEPLFSGVALSRAKVSQMTSIASLC
jgi:hypothetical protein